MGGTDWNPVVASAAAPATPDRNSPAVDRTFSGTVCGRARRVTNHRAGAGWIRRRTDREWIVFRRLRQPPRRRWCATSVSEATAWICGRGVASRVGSAREPVISDDVPVEMTRETIGLVTISK